MTSAPPEILARALEMIGTDWEENHTPAAVRCSLSSLELLCEVRRLVADPRSGLRLGWLTQFAPTFVRQYKEVMLIEVGADHRGRLSAVA
jgi:hypothetical protein